MIKKLSDYKKAFRKYLENHKKFRIFFEYSIAAIGTLISAALIAFSFKAFLSPNNTNIVTIITGGTSGLARTIALIVNMINKNNSNTYVVYSVVYFILNVPIIYICFRFISFRFALFTTLNVVIVSLMTTFINLDFINVLAEQIACVINNGTYNLQAGILSRSILSALFSAVATCLAFAAGTSAGGADALSYFFALRKSTNVGKYLVAINSVVIILYSCLFFSKEVWINEGFTPTILADTFLVLFFAVIYLIVLSLVIDFINRRNKKEQIQIITKEENLSKLLLANIPHGATIVHAKGAFTGEDRIIIYIIVSIYETKSVIDLVKSADPKSFINITSVKQVYGRFFIKPIK